MVRQVCHARALYACEASHVDEHSLAAYATEVVKMLSPSTFKAANGLIFLHADAGNDLDLAIVIYARRVSMFRKNPTIPHHRRSL